MIKKVIISGSLGALVLIITTFLVNGILGFKNKIEMKPIENEREVYELLKENITKPGKYICNPEITKDMRFPDNEPVYSILYAGIGHESAGKLMLLGLVIFLTVPFISAWMLSQASEKVLNSYGRKVLFFVCIGILFALLTHLSNYGIGNYPFKESIILAIHSIIIWTFMGLVIAWKIKPD